MPAVIHSIVLLRVSPSTFLFSCKVPEHNVKLHRVGQKKSTVRSRVKVAHIVKSRHHQAKQRVYIQTHQHIQLAHQKGTQTMQEAKRFFFNPYGWLGEERLPYSRLRRLPHHLVTLWVLAEWLRCVQLLGGAHHRLPIKHEGALLCGVGAIEVA